MRKRDLLKEINETLEIFGKASNLNEAVNFAENYNGEYDDFDETPEEEKPSEMVPQAEEEPAPQAEPDEVGKEGSTPLKNAPVEEPSEEEKGLEEMGSEVDRIREIALRGMVKLCHNTEDPAYDALKKIFQFCDKANEKKEEPVK